MNKPILLTTAEAADYLNGAVKPHTLEEWRRLEKGPAYTKIGRLVRYDVRDLDKYLEEQKSA